MRCFKESKCCRIEPSHDNMIFCMSVTWSGFVVAVWSPIAFLFFPPPSAVALLTIMLAGWYVTPPTLTLYFIIQKNTTAASLQHQHKNKQKQKQKKKILQLMQPNWNQPLHGYEDTVLLHLIQTAGCLQLLCIRVPNPGNVLACA